MQKQQPRLDPKRLVFIDETSVSTTITRLYGRAPQGERLVQKVPHGNWKTITFIAALRHDRITAPFVLEGPMTGEMFKAYTEQFLAPTLTRGDVVFMTTSVFIKSMESKKPLRLAAQFRFISSHIAQI